MIASTSAWYPLVKNFMARSTRRGVASSPSRDGSSPSSESNCRMISCILLVYLAAFAGGVTQSVDPDALYAQREDVGSARRAADVWASRLQADPKDFESAWKLARARYWLGGHASENERKTFLENGIAAGRAAAAL